MYHILFVDDDVFTQRVMAEVLADAGYAVTNVSRGMEAVRLLSECSDAFDVLVTEADLPDSITGVSLASFSRRMRPGRPTVFTSEHSETFIEWLHEDEAILQKPFDGHALLEAIGAALH